MNEPEPAVWWSEGVRFSCKGCGRCCRGEPGAIFFTAEEGGRVRDFLGVTEGDFQRSYVTRMWGRPSFIERRNGDCVFYNAEQAKCKIYPIRPLQCQLFPFWASVMESRENWDRESRRCPGLDEGQLHTAQEIKTAIELDPFGDL